MLLLLVLHMSLVANGQFTMKIDSAVCEFLSFPINHRYWTVQPTTYNQPVETENMQRSHKLFTVSHL